MLLVQAQIINKPASRTIASEVSVHRFTYVAESGAAGAGKQKVRERRSPVHAPHAGLLADAALGKRVAGGRPASVRVRRKRSKVAKPRRQ